MTVLDLLPSFIGGIAGSLIMIGIFLLIDRPL